MTTTLVLATSMHAWLTPTSTFAQSSLNCAEWLRITCLLLPLQTQNHQASTFHTVIKKCFPVLSPFKRDSKQFSLSLILLTTMKTWELRLDSRSISMSLWEPDSTLVPIHRTLKILVKERPPFGLKSLNWSNLRTTNRLKRLSLISSLLLLMKCTISMTCWLIHSNTLQWEMKLRTLMLPASPLLSLAIESALTHQSLPTWVLSLVLRCLTKNWNGAQVLPNGLISQFKTLKAIMPLVKMVWELLLPAQLSLETLNNLRSKLTFTIKTKFHNSMS